MKSVTIAMWSGPRNISTAMMYSFGNRGDCEAWDEPFYAFSLLHHGNDHPRRDEIIAAYDTDWDVLVPADLFEISNPLEVDPTRNQYSVAVELALQVNVTAAVET